MRVQGDPVPANNGVFYLLGDHLGSTSIVADSSGSKVSDLRYRAFGETRFAWGTTPTDYRYTGQREESLSGLYDYGARWYDPAVGRFIQADTIIPGRSYPPAWDRYAYAFNKPTGNTDPGGHRPCDEKLGCFASPPPYSPKPTLPPFTTDDSWGDEGKKERLEKILTWMADWRGPKWWSESVPSVEEWAAFLYSEEGGVLDRAKDKELMIWILVWQINRSGASSFTPSTNPVIGPELYEQMNFTVNDVHALIHPDSRLLQEGFWLTDEITSANGTETKPDYLYWVSEREMRDADVSLDNLDFAWHLAPTVNGSFLVFLRAHEDFDRVISSLP